MRKPSLGTVCIVLGVLLMLAAGGLYAYNRYEDAHAGAEAQTVVQDLEEKVVEKTETAAESTPEEMTAELPSVFVDGYDYVGVLTIPALDLRLPVMQDWSYPKLKIAPCRQYGSSRTNDLVIAAHNYETHFGKIGTLAVGDEVRFTDMDGIDTYYSVQKVEVHEPTDVDAVKNSGYDLVLYTCTYGGKTRIVVFCDRD